MREILSRGKRIDNGEWVEGDLFHNDDERFPMTMIGHVICSRNKHNGEIDFDGYDLLEVDISSVGQYTGLTDENGQRIFEGDIIRCGVETAPVRFGEYAYGIRWKTHVGFYVDWNSDGLRKDIGYWAEDRKIKVIGNIHDNPELLKEA